VKRSQNLPAELGSVSVARQFVRETLESVPGSVLDAVELMVSELATNSVKHAKTSFEVVIERSGTVVRVEVSDRGNGDPTPRNPRPSDPTGRGLRIVDLLSDKWGVRHAGDTTTVWFLLQAGDVAGGNPGVTGRAMPAA